MIRPVFDFDRNGHGPVDADPCHGTLVDGAPVDGGLVARALETQMVKVAARWKPTILYHLALAPHRRRDLDRCLPDSVSSKVLTGQLRGLEEDGLIVRIDRRAAGLSEQRHVTYALSPAGEALRPTIEAFTRWCVMVEGGAGRKIDTSALRRQEQVVPYATQCIVDVQAASATGQAERS